MQPRRPTSGAVKEVPSHDVACGGEEPNTLFTGPLSEGNPQGRRSQAKFCEGTSSEFPAQHLACEGRPWGFPSQSGPVDDVLGYSPPQAAPCEGSPQLL